MPRPFWSGAISFGLLNIPVKLYSATSSKDIHFHQIDRKSGARVRQKRVSEKTGKEVPYEQIAKGYEVSKGRFVLIEPEELEKLDPKGTRTIDIQDFVDLTQIDPIYFEQSYYLVPDERAGKAYGLLLHAMQTTGKVAVARVVLRTKEYLSVVRPGDKVLVMSTMRYADEVVPAEQLPELPKASSEPSPKELKMAEQLIASLSGEFEPDKYHDEYRERVLALIDKKAAGMPVEMGEAEEAPNNVVDLISALEASLKAAKKAPAAKTAKKAEGRARKSA